MATYDTPEHDFEEAFGPLFDSLWKTFALKDESTLDQPSPDPEEGIDDDVENVLLVERKTKEWRNHTKDLVDHAREQLRGIKLDYKSAVTASQRSSTIPSTTDHQRQLETMFQQTLQTVKLNSELDQQVMELQGELVRLNQELKEQEKEVVQVGELNGDVLKLKMYRDLGFTPIPNEQGKFTKIIVQQLHNKPVRSNWILQ